jgi:hypothetical protein
MIEFPKRMNEKSNVRKHRWMRVSQRVLIQDLFNYSIS